MTDQQSLYILCSISIFFVCFIVYFNFNHILVNENFAKISPKRTRSLRKLQQEKNELFFPNPTRPLLKQQHDKKGSAKVVTVHSVGNFVRRVATFNEFLSSFREQLLSERDAVAWQTPTSNRPKIVWGKSANYLQLPSTYSNVTTIVLPWLVNSSTAVDWNPFNDNSNMLLQMYYGWSADERMCTCVTNRRKCKKYYSGKCSTSMNGTMRPLSIRRSVLNLKLIGHSRQWPNDSYFYPKPMYVLFFVHIHTDAIVTLYGDVFSGNLKFMLPTCIKDTRLTLRKLGNVKRFPLYNELFVITQFWGRAYFHQMIEVIPRIALYVNFLLHSPKINIVTPSKSARLAKLLQIVGIHRSRLVTGVARGKIVYQPRTTSCGSANLHEIQMLSKLYSDYIKEHFVSQPRNRIVLIHRSRSRRFKEQKAVENVLKRAARDYNLRYTLFRDNPVPSIKNTMLMFHSAVVIVAPHGAGLANMIFSQPGTYIVEGVCRPPVMNLCYRRLAFVLGHHWHGIMSISGGGGVVDVTALSIDNAVRNYLGLRKLQESW